MSTEPPTPPPGARFARRLCRLTARLLAVVTLSLTTTPAALAQPYRYVDEAGVTVYSQTPPAAAAGNVEQVPLDPGPPPGAYDAARERLQRQLEAEADAREAARQAAGERAAAAEQAAARAANCQAARQNRETIQNLGARFLRQADGSVAPVSEAERADLIRTAEQQIREFCD